MKVTKKCAENDSPVIIIQSMNVFSVTLPKVRFWPGLISSRNINSMRLCRDPWFFVITFLKSTDCRTITLWPFVLILWPIMRCQQLQRGPIGCTGHINGNFTELSPKTTKDLSSVARSSELVATSKQVDLNSNFDAVLSFSISTKFVLVRVFPSNTCLFSAVFFRSGCVALLFGTTHPRHFVCDANL